MRRTRKDKNTKRSLIYILPVLIIGLLMGTGFFINEYAQKSQETNGSKSEPTNQSDNTADSEVNEPDSSPEADNESKAEPEKESESEDKPDSFTDIRIAASGDIMFHDTQLESAYDAQNKTYDFKSVFEDVKPIFSAADLALANLETTTAGSTKPYTGYPVFNSPDETIDAIKYAGIDVLTTANNHSLDTGREGLKRTVEVIRDKGLSSVGSYDTKPDSRVLMKDVKGIKIAILSYTESTNGLGSKYPHDELNAMLNLMDEDIIVEDIQEAKEMGADLIITFMHWGEEYKVNPNAKQVEFAHMMAEEGADIVLGSHPHVIQKSEVLEVNDHKTFVIYSMGNFVSNQRRETLDNELTEAGIIVNFDVRQNDHTKETTIENVEYMPTWVYRNKEEGESTYTYRILPIKDFTDSTDISEIFKNRMKESLETTVSKMEESPF